MDLACEASWDGFSVVYNCHVRVKTSISLPRELLERIDNQSSNRSRFLEKAAAVYLNDLQKRQREARDAEIIRQRADELNKEALDVLEYQGPR